MKLKLIRTTLISIIIAASTFVNISKAGLITTSLTNPDKLIDFSQFDDDYANYTGQTEIGGLVGESVLWKPNNNNGFISYRGWGLNSSGFWGGGRNGYVAVSGSISSMEFVFVDSPINTFSIYMNYAHDAHGIFNYPDTIMSAYGINGNLLETHNITADSAIPILGGNLGEYRGITRDSNDIYSFKLSNGYVVADNLSFSRVISEVPEPSTLAIFALGLIGLTSRRFKNK